MGWDRLAGTGVATALKIIFGPPLPYSALALRGWEGLLQKIISPTALTSCLVPDTAMGGIKMTSACQNSSKLTEF